MKSMRDVILGCEMHHSKFLAQMSTMLMWNTFWE